MIELEHYKPDPKRQGYLILDRMASVEEVFRQCERALADAGLLRDMEYFQTDRESASTWPQARWVGVFPVRGGSEGHYIHVEAVALLKDGACPRQTDERRLMITGKTFMGMDHAIKVCNVLTRAFYED